MSVKIKNEKYSSDEDVEVPRRPTTAHSGHRSDRKQRDPVVVDDHRRRQEDRRDDDHRREHRESRDRSSHKQHRGRDEEDARGGRSGEFSRRDRPSDQEDTRGGHGRGEGRDGHARSGENRPRDGRGRGRGRGGHSGGRVKEVWGRPEDEVKNEEEAPVKKEEPSLALTGKLVEETNTFRGVVIKYNEPDDARKPETRWRLYPFKGDQVLPVLYIHRQSGYLVGRDHKICDIPMDHPSISKQHAVIQFRQIEYTRPNNKKGLMVKPYLIDLESSNGTFLNNQKLEATRYVELKEKDMMKFGFSSREYVLLSEATGGGDVSESSDD